MLTNGFSPKFPCLSPVKLGDDERTIISNLQQRASSLCKNCITGSTYTCASTKPPPMPIRAPAFSPPSDELLLLMSQVVCLCLASSPIAAGGERTTNEESRIKDMRTLGLLQFLNKKNDMQSHPLIEFGQPRYYLMHQSVSLN